MYESISKNNELENEMTLDMSYFWFSDEGRMAKQDNIPHHRLGGTFTGRPSFITW